MLSALALGSMLAVVLAACAPRIQPRPRPPNEAIPRTSVPALVGAEPSILSAQHRDPTLADLEEGRTIAALVFLVLSVEVDPATLDPEFFVVSLDDGRRRRPARVRLISGSESDENRTLSLAIARPEGATQVRPLAVTITGPVFGEGGESLVELAAEIDRIERPPRLVLALREAAHEGSCAGTAQAVRTFWSVPIAGGESPDLAAISVNLDDGSVVPPQALDDHRLGAGALQEDDNVVEFCLAEQSPAKRIAVPGSLFRDHYGIASAAGDFAILRASP